MRELAQYPDDIHHYFESRRGQATTLADGERIPQGGRDATLASLAGSLRSRGLTETEIRAALLTINDERCDPPLDHRDVRRIARSISKYAPGSPELIHIAITGQNGHDPNEPDPDPGTGWTPQDAVQLANNPHTDPDVGPLFYSGLRHVVSGESEAGKSLLCLAVAADEILCGRHVLYIDFDGMGATMSVDLLRGLGVPDNLISSHFLYIVPESVFAAAKQAVLDLLDRHQIRLVVIDTFNPGLIAHGLDPEKTTDTDVFYRDVVAPLRSRGAAVVLLDHVTKSKDARGRYSYGAEGKLTRCDVALGLEMRSPIGRGRTGIVAVKTHKDRPSRLPRPNVGTLTWISDPATGLITWTLKKATPTDPDKPFRPTHVMEKVSLYLEQHGQSTMKEIEGGVDHGRDVVRTAVQRLTHEDHAAETKGPHAARLIEIISPYRELHDPDSDSYIPSSPPRPSSPVLARGDDDSSSPARPVLTRGEDGEDKTPSGLDQPPPTLSGEDDPPDKWWDR